MYNLFERYLLYLKYYVFFLGNCFNKGGEIEVV